ncbi:hypothetical protein BH11MYX3_BH11MYX3_28090 [soil metagenome]
MRPRLRRGFRWLRRIVVGILALVVIAVTVVLIVLHTAWGRNVLKNQVVSQIQTFFPGTTIGSITGSVLGTLVLHDVHLVALDHKPLADVETLELDLSLLPLISKTAHMDLLRATGVTLYARPLPPFPQDKPPSWVVELDRVEVHDARVIVEANGMTLTDVDIAASAHITPLGPIKAVAKLGGSFEGQAFGGMALVRVDDDDVTIPFASFGRGHSFVVANEIGVLSRRGTVIAGAPAAELALRVPKLPALGDGLVIVHAKPIMRETQVVLTALLGPARIDGALLVDIEARRARGVLGGSGVELATVTNGKVNGHGRAVIAGTVEDGHARATVIAGGSVQELPEGHAVIALEGWIDQADVLLFATGAGGARVGAVGHVSRVDELLIVDKSQVGAAVSDPMVASGGRFRAHGAVEIQAAASGPIDALAVQGTVDATRVVYDRLAVARLAGKFQATLASPPLGNAHVVTSGIVVGGKPIGAVTADAKLRRDGRIEVKAHGAMAVVPVVGDATATVTIGKTVEVALGGYRLDTPAGIWTGTGGHVQITKRMITVSGIRPTQGTAWVKLDATVGRGNDSITTAIEAHAVPISAIDPRYTGTVTAVLSLVRARGRWSGGGTLNGTALVLGAELPQLDASVTASVDGRRVSLGLNASNSELGGARLAVEVDGPKDLLDKDQWLRVARSDLHALAIGFDHVNAAALSKGRTAGTLDGTVELREGVPTGAVTIRGVPTPVGPADADVTLAISDAGLVEANLKANVGAIGATAVGVRLVIPDHPFDPAAWMALGPHLVHDATVVASDITITPSLLTLFDLNVPLNGKASVKLELGDGAATAVVTADIKNLTGGPLVRGIDVHVEGSADARGTRAAVRVSSGTTTLAELPDLATPITLAQWMAGAKAAKGSALSGTLSIGPVDAKTVLGLVGRDDVQTGTIAGSFTLGGTLGVPIGSGTLDLKDVRIARKYTNKPAQALTALHLDATWDGTSGHLTITGEEERKGTLLVDVQGSPADLASVIATIKVDKFDLAPIVVFLPGQLAGASGVVAADLTIKGVNPLTAKIRGTLSLVDGRVPITASIGTLRKANVKVEITDAGLTASLDGKVGAGSIRAKATSDAGVHEVVFDASLQKVSPIGALQPVIDATVHGTFKRTGTAWVGKVAVTNANVLVPTQTGNALLDAAVPVDLVFIDLPIRRIPLAAGAPYDPWLIAEVTLSPTQITVPEFVVDAIASGRVTVSVGDTIGLFGEVVIERGSADLFGHRYRVEFGQLEFDGTKDGRLDLKLAHDFPEVTTFVRFADRVSALPTSEPEFSSSPGVYSQGQLLGFFLGGEPGGDPTKQTREAAAGFGAALASTTIGRRLKRYLPISLDVLRCDPGGGTSGASCTLGTWLTHKVFLSYKQRMGARYDENSGEIAIEWHFKPSWELDITAGDRNIHGGDVLWRRRW